MFRRILTPYKSNSFFLFGARGTGKTTCLRGFFDEKSCLWFDLLDPELEEEFARNPKALSEAIAAHSGKLSWVVIDEVQKVPRLLDLVHLHIERDKLRFALTGSSARKLKRGQANMLAGRAFVQSLFPLTHVELGKNFSLPFVLQWGSLPKIFSLSQDLEKQEYLKAYTRTYLQEEVLLEQLIRKLTPFRRFLEVAAQNNGEILNYTNMGRDISVDFKTVQSYYHILEDTLLGFFLPSYHRSLRRQLRQAPKFYFFDPGVVRALTGTLSVPLLPSTYGFGRAFEHWVILEVFRLNEYLKKDFRLSYARTLQGIEVDLVIERPGKPLVLVEIKSSEQVDERNTKALISLQKEFPNSELRLWSRSSLSRKIGEVLALPWQEGLKELELSP